MAGRRTTTAPLEEPTEGAGRLLELRAVTPSTVVPGAHRVLVEVHGAGFRRGVRVGVSGTGLRLSHVRVVDGGSTTLHVRATRWAHAGRRTVVVTSGKRRVACFGCLIVAHPR